MKLIISFAVCFSIAISKASTQTEFVAFSNSQPLENDWTLRQSKSVFSDDDTTTTSTTPKTPTWYKLDTKEDANNTARWTYPRPFPGYFEYYDNNTDLKSSSSNQSLCAHSIKDSLEQLNEVKGIWIACQDQELPDGCKESPNSPCYPFIYFNAGINNPELKTVQISISLRGLATVRLTLTATPSTISSNFTCFDFSLRRDPLSPCEYVTVIGVENNNWVDVQSALDAYSPITFATFTVQLIARFKKDVALVDWIQVTDQRLCENNATCVTTPTPSTTPKTTTPPPPTNATTEASSDYDDYEDETTTIKVINSSDSISVLKMCIFLSLITNLVTAIIF